MEKGGGDDDLDNLLDEALDDFEREESREPPAPKPATASAAAALASSSAEMQREIESTLEGMSLPPEMDEFRKVLLESFSQMASLAEQEDTKSSSPGDASSLSGAGDAQMVEAFLKDVLSKEVLYEPMREMRDKYPQWLASHRETLSPEDTLRYESQSALLVEICRAYETDAPFDIIAVLMEKISSLGQAPAEMLAELSPEAAAAGAASGGPGLPPGAENCCLM